MSSFDVNQSQINTNLFIHSFNFEDQETQTSSEDGEMQISPENKKMPTQENIEEEIAQILQQLSQGPAQTYSENDINLSGYKKQLAMEQKDDIYYAPLLATNSLKSKENVYQKVYTFPTNTGFGMIGQLSHNGETYNGILYVGISNANMIFHKCFEEVNFTDTTIDLFQDVEQISNEMKSIDSANWQSEKDYDLNISNKGVLSFKYSDHELSIYPVNDDLFKKELAKVK